MYCTYIQYVGTINFGPIGPRHFLFGKRIRRSKKQRPHCWSSVRTLLFLPILSSKPYFWPRKKCFWIVVVILFLLFNLQNFVLFSVNIVVYFCTVVENYTHIFFATWTSVLFIFVAVIILTFSFTQQLSVAVFLQSFQRHCVCAAHMQCSLRQMPLLVSYSWICLYISVQPHRFCDLLPVTCLMAVFRWRYIYASTTVRRGAIVETLNVMAAQSNWQVGWASIRCKSYCYV